VSLDGVQRAVDGNQHFGTADAKPSVTIHHTADHKAPVLDNRLVDIELEGTSSVIIYSESFG